MFDGHDQPSLRYECVQHRLEQVRQGSNDAAMRPTTCFCGGAGGVEVQAVDLQPHDVSGVEARARPSARNSTSPCSRVRRDRAPRAARRRRLGSRFFRATSRAILSRIGLPNVELVLQDIASSLHAPSYRCERAAIPRRTGFSKYPGPLRERDAQLVVRLGAQQIIGMSRQLGSLRSS